MLNLTAIRNASSMQEVLAVLPEQAPDVLTHVVLRLARGQQDPALAGVVLALGEGPARVGYRHVLTPAGPVEVSYGEIAAFCYQCADPAYGQAKNWSRTGLKGDGFHATHAEALAALPGLAADAERRAAEGQQRAQSAWTERTNARRYR
jgi:hypothetical protein